MLAKSTKLDYNGDAVDGSGNAVVQHEIGDICYSRPRMEFLQNYATS